MLNSISSWHVFGLVSKASRSQLHGMYLMKVSFLSRDHVDIRFCFIEFSLCILFFHFCNRKMNDYICTLHLIFIYKIELTTWTAVSLLFLRVILKACLYEEDQPSGAKLLRVLGGAAFFNDPKRNFIAQFSGSLYFSRAILKSFIYIALYCCFLHQLSIM